jgi:hypothetical protein
MAAQVATKKVAGLVGDDGHGLKRELDRMHRDAADTEKRCTELADGFKGKKTAILAQARETKGEAAEMLRIYLGAEADALDGFEFLTMAEAGEVGHWSIVKKFNERARDRAVGEVVAWALPIQERHYQTVVNASLTLAADEDPEAAM